MNIAVIYLFHEAKSTAIMCDEIQPKKQNTEFWERLLHPFT